MSTEQDECFRAFQALESERLAVLDHLAQWPPECLRFRPAPEAWSAPEVLDHIVRAEACTIADVRATLQNPHPLGDEERPRIAVLNRSLRSNRSFKVPAGAEMIHPDAQADLPDVVRRWKQARAELRSLIEGLSPEDACCGAFEHPFAGWMTLREVIEHCSAHLYHHRFQLDRLRTSWAELLVQSTQT